MPRAGKGLGRASPTVTLAHSLCPIMSSYLLHRLTTPSHAPRAETYLFRHALGKMLWVLLQPAFYALRPVLVLPKRMTQAEAMGWAIQVRAAGGRALVCRVRRRRSRVAAVDLTVRPSAIRGVGAVQCALAPPLAPPPPQLAFDAAVLYFWGFKSLVYLIASTLLGTRGSL
jgi:hypothetical protein